MMGRNSALLAPGKSTRGWIVEPIVLIHGYSSERADTPADIQAIYGTLVSDLQRRFAEPPLPSINFSRYISLDDSVDVDDLSLALDRALQVHPSGLLDVERGFNAIVHSTGSLVVRNWVRRFSPKKSPLKRLVHLAGANFGSGWGHIGEKQLVRWGRYALHAGEERGLAVLKALELGSSWTLDLHRHFLQPGNDMLGDYGVMEFNIVGSQVPAPWMIVPVRYGKEDGSDGVVRVAGSNLNFNYMHIVPRQPHRTNWSQAEAFSRFATQTAAPQTTTALDEPFGGYYEIKEDNRPAGGAHNGAGGGAVKTRPRVPFAIPYGCAHSSDDVGVVYGARTRREVLPLVQSALQCRDAQQYQECVEAFDRVTQRTYDMVLKPRHQRKTTQDVGDLFLGSLFSNPRGQYDKHAQLIVRVRDQHGKPVDDFSIHFNSWGGDTVASGVAPCEIINTLFEDKHKNNSSPNIITFYLRLERYEKGRGFVPRLPEIGGVDLEIDAYDASTDRIRFVPLRYRITAAELEGWLQPHRTTILDVELLRLPSDSAFVVI